MFLSWNPHVPHSPQEQKKTAFYLSSFVMIACAGILSSSKPDNDILALRLSPQLENNIPFSPSFDAKIIVEKILEARKKEWILMEEKRENNIRKMSRIPLTDRWIYWTYVFRDLRLDASMILDLIQRESKWLPHLTSSKWAKWLMQLKDIVLDDMMGVGWIKKYGSFFLSLRTDTLEKMSYEEDGLKIATLKKLIRNILVIHASQDKTYLNEYLEEYNQLIFSLKSELYNPDINLIFGSIYTKYLEKLSSEISEDRMSTVTHIIEHLDINDLDRINQLRSADKKSKLSSDYDFSTLDIRKVITLSMYNVWPNAKDMKPGILYAVAILV